MKPAPPNLHTQPAKELAFATNTSNVVRTLAAAFAAVLILNGISFYLLDYFSSNLGYRVLRTKWDRLMSMESPVDVLVLGDSSARQGVDTDLIAELTGKSVVNLATTGDALALNDYWLLNAYITTFGAPNCVIDVHVYDVWHRGINESVVSQVPISAAEMLQEFSRMQLGVKKKIKFLVARYAPSVAQNTSLKKILMYPWAATAQELSLTATGFVRINEANPKRVYRDATAHKTFVSENTFSPSKENLYAVEKMAKLAESLGFKLIFANSPIFEGLYFHKSFRVYLSTVNRFIESAIGKYKNVDHVFVVPVTFGSSEMENVDHLTANAAKLYTRRLLESTNCWN